MRLTVQTVMGNGPTAVSEFKNGIGHRVELENRYGSLAHREFESLPLRQASDAGDNRHLCPWGYPLRYSDHNILWSTRGR